MPFVSHHSYQLHSIFGAGYVPEQHADESAGYLPVADQTETGAVNFGEIMRLLRSALSLQRAT